MLDHTEDPTATERSIRNTCFQFRERLRDLWHQVLHPGNHTKDYPSIRRSDAFRLHNLLQQQVLQGNQGNFHFIFQVSCKCSDCNALKQCHALQCAHFKTGKSRTNSIYDSSFVFIVGCYFYNTFSEVISGRQIHLIKNFTITSTFYSNFQVSVLTTAEKLNTTE